MSFLGRRCQYDFIDCLRFAKHQTSKAAVCRTRFVSLDINAETIEVERDDTDSDNLFIGGFVLHQVYCCQASSLFMVIGLQNLYLPRTMASLMTDSKVHPAGRTLTSD